MNRIGQRVTYFAATRLGVAQLPGEIVGIAEDGRVTLSVYSGEMDADDAIRVFAIESDNGQPGTFKSLEV